MSIILQKIGNNASFIGSIFGTCVGGGIFIGSVVANDQYKMGKSIQSVYKSFGKAFIYGNILVVYSAITIPHDLYSVLKNSYNTRQKILTK